MKTKTITYTTATGDTREIELYGASASEVAAEKRRIVREGGKVIKVR